jgi:hypothetical protein
LTAWASSGYEELLELIDHQQDPTITPNRGALPPGLASLREEGLPRDEREPFRPIRQRALDHPSIRLREGSHLDGQLTERRPARNEQRRRPQGRPRVSHKPLLTQPGDHASAQQRGLACPRSTGDHEQPRVSQESRQSAQDFPGRLRAPEEQIRVIRLEGTQPSVWRAGHGRPDDVACLDLMAVEVVVLPVVRAELESGRPTGANERERMYAGLAGALLVARHPIFPASAHCDSRHQ